MLHLYSEIPPYSGYFGLGVCEIISLTLNYIFKTVVLVFFFLVIYNLLYLLKQA